MQTVNIFLLFSNVLAYLSCFLVSEATIDDRINCIRYSCDFENGNLCWYASENPSVQNGQKRGPSRKWQVFRGYDRRSFHGAKHFGRSISYAAVFLSKDESAILATRDRGFGPIRGLNEDRVIKFKYYETAPGIRLKACCDDVERCPFLPERKLGPSKPRWKMASFECKAGARKVLFHVKNTGIWKAGVRIDDIRIFYPPDYYQKFKANKDVCAMARAENQLNKAMRKITLKPKNILKLPSRHLTRPPKVPISPPRTRAPHPTSPKEADPQWTELVQSTPSFITTDAETSDENITAEASTADVSDPSSDEEDQEKRIYVVTLEDNDLLTQPENITTEVPPLVKTTSYGPPGIRPENLTTANELSTYEPPIDIFDVYDENDTFSVIMYQKNLEESDELIRRDEPLEALRVLNAQQVPLTSGQGDDLNCAAVVCNFEQGTLCNYQNFQSSDVQFTSTRGSWQQFQVYNSRYRNAATGIRQPGEGMGFAAAYLKTGDKAALASEGQLKSDGIRFVYPLTADKVIRFKYYKVADLIELKGCCDNLANCPFSSGTQAKNTDFARWKTGNFICKAGTLRFLFYAVNDGPNEGAVGLDDIQLFLPSGGPPETAQQNACDNSGRTNTLTGGGPIVAPAPGPAPGPVVVSVVPGPAGPASYVAPPAVIVGGVAPTVSGSGGSPGVPGSVGGNPGVDLRGSGWGPNPNNTLNGNPVVAPRVQGPGRGPSPAQSSPMVGGNKASSTG